MPTPVRLRPFAPLLLAGCSVRGEGGAGVVGRPRSRAPGRFMKEWMAKYEGLADGKLVQDALKALG